MNNLEHFGIKVNNDELLKKDDYVVINKKSSFNYLILKDEKYYDDPQKLIYSDKWCNNYKTLILRNYDINMERYYSLDEKKFNYEVDTFLKNHPNFKELTDINDVWNISGYYIMILDKYKQIYIGTSENIGKRIQQHWQNSKIFDRMLFPMYSIANSKLSIDSFKALDTTRIFYEENINTFQDEDKYINYFSDEFLLNRIKGGILNKQDIIKMKFDYLKKVDTDNFKQDKMQDSFRCYFSLEEIADIFELNSEDLLDSENFGYVLGKKVKLYEYAFTDFNNSNATIMLLPQNTSLWVKQFNYSELNYIFKRLNLGIEEYRNIGRYDKVVDLKDFSEEVFKEIKIREV